MDKLKTYTINELRIMLAKDPNAYISVIRVEAVRLDTYLASYRRGTELPLRCIDQGQASVENAARDALYKHHPRLS